MVVSIPILPGALLVSLAGTMMVVDHPQRLVATIVAPALLALLGPNVNRWRIGKPEATDSPRVMTFVDAALRRPVVATVVIGGIVLVLAAPAFGLKTGPPSTEQLPEQQRRARGLRRRPEGDRARLRSAVRRRRRDRRRDDDRTRPPRRSWPSGSARSPKTRRCRP